MHARPPVTGQITPILIVIPRSVGAGGFVDDLTLRTCLLFGLLSSWELSRTKVGHGSLTECGITHGSMSVELNFLPW